jgi:hypothetical protein
LFTYEPRGLILKLTWMLSYPVKMMTYPHRSLMHWSTRVQAAMTLGMVEKLQSIQPLLTRLVVPLLRLLAGVDASTHLLLISRADRFLKLIR